MAKLSMISIAVLTLMLTVVLVFGAFGLAVREGVSQEVTVWFPSRGKYQLILRVGTDALPWTMRRNGPTAINLWAHGRGTDWHIFRLLSIPLGERTTKQT